jgi:multiple sugar transport system substrate-binding protein
MNESNKHIIFWCVLFMSCALVGTSGCRKGESEGTLTFAVGGAPAELDFWEKLIGEFETQSGIEVNLLRQPTDTDLRRQAMVTSLQAERNDPDVFLMDVAWLAQFAASDWLEPLDSYAKDDELNLEVFFQRVLNLADRYHGTLVALPVYVDGGLLYYRKDLLDAYGIEGPPQTWQKLVEDSLKVQEDMRKSNPNFCGFVWQGAQYEGLVCTWLEFAGSGGGGIAITDDVISLDTGANVAATRFMYDLVHTHKVSPPNTFTEMKEEEVRSFFQQGNALFERNWPYAWALHQSEDSPVKDKVGIAALPHFAGGKSVSTLGGWHIGVSKYSDTKEKSFALVRFITSYGSQKKLALNLGWNPGRRDVYVDEDVVEKSPHFASLQDIFENLLPRPTLPYYTLISEVIQRHVNAVLSGKSAPGEALASAEKEAQEIIQRYAKD